MFLIFATILNTVLWYNEQLFLLCFITTVIGLIFFYYEGRLCVDGSPLWFEFYLLATWFSTSATIFTYFCFLSFSFVYLFLSIFFFCLYLFIIYIFIF